MAKTAARKGSSPLDGWKTSARCDAVRTPWAALLCLTIVLVSCRVPDPPVLKDKSRGLVYDTAMESEIKSGKAPKLVTTAVARYIDTLAEPVAITGWKDATCCWQVFVATNRGKFTSPDDREAVNLVLDQPQYGRCDVQLPRQQRGTEPQAASDRKGSGILSASATSASSSSGPLVAVDSQPLNEESFLEGVSDQVRRSRQHDLLIFVHGFNVSFDAAVARTAQLALDMPFNGAVVSYCWPTQGGALNYSDDEPINKASVGPFTEFLRTLRAAVPAESRIHIVVHSMGNRIVMESLNQLPAPRGTKPFANVALCAPDVGRSDFVTWAPGVSKQSDRVTLYASMGDTALIASKSLHSEERAGDAWQPLVVEGVETIDCSRIDLTFMGHSYYGSNTDVLSDLFMLIKEDLPANRRPHLAKKKSMQGSYWQFAQSAPAVHYAWHFDK